MSVEAGRVSVWGVLLSLAAMALAAFTLYVTWAREDEFTQAYRRGEALHVLERIWREQQEGGDGQE